MRKGTILSRHRRAMRGLAWVALCCLLGQPLGVLAQTAAADAMIVRPGDTLRLVVPERPELDQELIVGAEGTVDVPQVGEILLSNLTLREAQLLMKQRLRLIHPTLDSLSLEMGRSATVRIYVLGEVDRAGMASFVKPPTLWDVVRHVGGPGEDADMAAARVIRESAEGPVVHPLDLSGILEGEGVPPFDLKDGDTLVIPARASGVGAARPGTGVKVFGGVGAPSVVAIRTPTPLLDVLMSAGTPTEDADLKKIWWVHREGGRDLARRVDLESYIKLGDVAGNPLLFPGDTINVEYSRPSWMRENLPFFLGIVTATATVLLAYDRLSE